MVDWCRTSKIALVASGGKMKYILATENMKAGDLIKTSQHIPRIPGTDHPVFNLNCKIYYNESLGTK
jgi:ribosomal protein L2